MQSNGKGFGQIVSFIFGQNCTSCKGEETLGIISDISGIIFSEMTALLG